jgi:Methyltransferase domain
MSIGHDGLGLACGMTKRPSADKVKRLAAGLGEKWPQRVEELDGLVDIIRSEGVRSYLEVGISHGFTFRHVGTCLPEGSRMTGVDNHGVWTPHLVETMALLKERGQDADMIWGDSTDSMTVQRARARGPYDLVLIDGDHSHAAVRGDWACYKGMARIVAFHDIDAHSNKGWDAARLRRFGVPSLWLELRSKYRHVEIISKQQRGMGIGVIWLREP